MANRQILPLGVADTPADYTIDSAIEVTIGSIFANYDGSGAGGSFVPTVELISDSGHTVIEVVQDSTIAAGDSVKASWAPFLKQGAPAATGGAVLPYAVVYDGFVSKAYPYPALDQVPFGSSAIHNDTGGIFSIIGGANLKQVQTSATGLYLVHTQVAWEAWPIATPVQIRLLGMPNYQGENNYNRDSEIVSANDQGVMEWTTTIAVNTAPYTFNLHAGQSSGINQWLDGNFCKVIRLTAI